MGRTTEVCTPHPDADSTVGRGGWSGGRVRCIALWLAGIECGRETGSIVVDKPTAIGIGVHSLVMVHVVGILKVVGVGIGVEHVPLLLRMGLVPCG